MGSSVSLHGYNGCFMYFLTNPANSVFVQALISPTDCADDIFFARSILTSYRDVSLRSVPFRSDSDGVVNKEDHTALKSRHQSFYYLGKIPATKLFLSITFLLRIIHPFKPPRNFYDIDRHNLPFCTRIMMRIHHQVAQDKNTK